MNFPPQIFLTILITITEQLHSWKRFCGCFHFTWLWLLISVTKRCAERCALQLYQTFLSKQFTNLIFIGAIMKNNKTPKKTTTLRVIRALVLQLLGTLWALVTYAPHALHNLVSQASRALRALITRVPCDLCATVLRFLKHSKYLI